MKKQKRPLNSKTDKKKETSKSKTADAKILLLEKLTQTSIVQVACKGSGISRATYYRWRNEDGEFAELADKAIKAGSLLINDMAESQLINAIKNGNMTGIIFWLKNHHFAYSDKILHNHKHDHNFPDISPEQAKEVARALKLAGIKAIIKEDKKASKEFEESDSDDRKDDKESP